MLISSWRQWLNDRLSLIMRDLWYLSVTLAAFQIIYLQWLSFIRLSVVTNCNSNTQSVCDIYALSISISEQSEYDRETLTCFSCTLNRFHDNLLMDSRFLEFWFKRYQCIHWIRRTFFYRVHSILVVKSNVHPFEILFLDDFRCRNKAVHMPVWCAYQN